jgi:hypothetical protein
MTDERNKRKYELLELGPEFILPRLGVYEFAKDDASAMKLASKELESDLYSSGAKRTLVDVSDRSRMRVVAVLSRTDRKVVDVVVEPTKEG